MEVGYVPENPITAIQQGGAKGLAPDYIILATSSEGTTRNGIGDTIKICFSLEKLHIFDKDTEQIITN